MHGIAWALAEELFDGKVWPGFIIEAAVYLVSGYMFGLMSIGQDTTLDDGTARD